MSNTRRDFLQAGTAALGATMASSLGQAQTGSGKRPNLIFFFGEGQRNDALSLHGHFPILKTPNHDRIAREGVNFRNAFVTNALCAPARAVALTGMYSHSTGALGNKDTPIATSIPMFTELLHQAGYEVAICGKVHIGNGVKERYWDYYLGYNSPATHYYIPKMFEGTNGNITGPNDYHGYADDVITDKALGWLKQKREKPFCLLVWFQAPHAPFYRARRHLDLYNGVPIAKPATFDDDRNDYAGKPRAFANSYNKIGEAVNGNDCPRSLEELVKDYCAGLVAVDENIGKIMNWLTETNQLDDTAILHSSDHGFFLGEWRMYDKRFMHEVSTRVPMMIRYPKLFPKGKVVDNMVLNLDIAPTLLEIAGVEIPKNMQGKSMVKLAQGDAAGWRKDWLYEYYEYPGGQQVKPHRGVRTDRYKFIHYYRDPEEFEMYDLQKDPGERDNLASDPKHADLRTQLTARLAELRRETNDTT